MLVAGCSGGDDDAATTVASVATTPSTPTPSTTTPPTTTPPTTPAAQVTDTTLPAVTEGLITEIEVLGGPDWLEADEHGVWAKLDNGSVVLISPATNAIVDTVDVHTSVVVCDERKPVQGKGFQAAELGVPLTSGADFMRDIGAVVGGPEVEMFVDAPSVDEQFTLF